MTAGTERAACGPGGRYSRPSAAVGVASRVPISSGANGLVLGQLTGTPGISASEAGSGHGSARRDQLTAAAIAAKVKPSRRMADNPQGDCFVAALLAMTPFFWASLRA